MSEELKGYKKLKEVAQNQRQYVLASSLPDKIIAKMIGDIEFANDTRGRECAFIRLQTKDGQVTTQKLTKSCYIDFIEAVEKCGGIEKIIKQYYVWERKQVGKAIHKRFMPTPNTQQ